MTDETPLSETNDLSQEERLLARLNGLIQYQSDLLDKVQRNRFRPYCHIPDLFELDTEATRPFSVPGTFISEQVGGNISVVNASGGFLASEPLDLILGSFLPGGYKRRWEFDLWTGQFGPSSKPGFADIDDGLQIRTSSKLSEVLPQTTEERYTPFEHPVDDVTVYIPQQFIVWSPGVGENNDITHYYWDSNNELVRNRKPEDVPDDELTTLKSDPTSQFLWFKHPLSRDEDPESQDLSKITDGLIERAEFSSDATFLKAYYATLLTLYGEDKTFSEVIRYRHDKDDSTAFVGSREESQVLMFELNRSVINGLLDKVFQIDSPLYRDLQFSLLYRRLWDRLFFQEEALEHAFSVTPFYRALIAVDYLFSTSSDGPNSLFKADVGEVKSRFPALLPSADQRLGLLDYDADDIENYEYLFTEYSDSIKSIIGECSNTHEVRRFAEHVLVHSIKHALASWATEYSAGGGDFEAWYDVNFLETTEETVEIGIYDSIQGGAGVSREVYNDLKQLSDDELLTGVTGQANCHIAATEETLVSLLNDYSGEYVFDLAQTAELGQEATEFRDAFQDIGTDFSYARYEDVVPLLNRRLSRICETKEMARFYCNVAETYTQTKQEICRTPRPVDIVFALEDKTFFDTRVRETYRRFANRRSQRRDLSELAERVEEITKQCIHACPDCLKRDSCTHQYRYQEQMLDRRLLARSLTTLDGGL
jgi:hypothetical protein